MPVAQPGHYVLACGDGNTYLEDLVWSSWGPETGEAKGSYFANDCTPNCGAGTIHSWPATVSVSRPKSASSGWLFTLLTVGYTTKTTHKTVSVSLPTKPPG
jgi:hypothetical protein